MNEESRTNTPSVLVSVRRSVSSEQRRAEMKRQVSELKDPSHVGFLLKRGHVRESWKKRWFVLKDKKLYYFPSNKGTAKPKGVVYLEGYIAEIVDDREIMKKMKRSLTLFKLSHSSEKEYLICADSEKEMEEWINAILLELYREFITLVDVDTPPERNNTIPTPKSSSTSRMSDRTSPSKENGAKDKKHKSSDDVKPESFAKSDEDKKEDAGESKKEEQTFLPSSLSNELEVLPLAIDQPATKTEEKEDEQKNDESHPEFGEEKAPEESKKETPEGVPSPEQNSQAASIPPESQPPESDDPKEEKPVSKEKEDAQSQESSKPAPAIESKEVQTTPESQDAEVNEPEKSRKNHPRVVCGKCGEKLVGEAVEAVGQIFHKDCFGCFDCQKKLTNSCLNIGGKPYCDMCGKRAFLRSRMQKNSATLGQKQSPLGNAV